MIRKKIQYEYHPNNSSLSFTDLEPDISYGPPAKDESKEVDTRVCLRVHSKRRRLADPDGLYFKAALDGIVAGGILRDDSAKFIKEISFSQEISEVEETVIDIVWDNEQS